MFCTLPAYGFYCRHIAGLAFSNVRTGFASADLRSALFCEDVDGLEVSSAVFAAVADGSPSIVLSDAKNAMIQGCRAYSLPAFLSVTGSNSREITVFGNDLHLTTRAVVIGDEVNSEAVFVAANHEPKRKRG